MRLGVGITLICMGAVSLSVEIPAPITVAQNVVASASGILLIAGLWTPVTGTVAALDEIWIALSSSSSQRDGEWIHILLGALCASAAMLGPGAWSIDARLFGRRRFPAHRTKEGSQPPRR